MTPGAPVFIAGLDHSGKTALRRALREHADIHVVRHLDLWTRLRALHAAGAPARERLLDALTTGRATSLGLDRVRLADAAAGPAFGDVVREIGRQLCARDVRGWGAQEALLEFEAERALTEMPEARVLYVVRDPRDRVAAMVDARAVGVGGVAAETAAWIASTRAAMRAAGARPDAVHIVRHEAHVSDPEATLRDVCAFLGQPYQPISSAAGSRPRSERGATRATLPPAHASFIEKHARPELVALGYRVEPDAPRTAMLPHRIADAARWRLGRLAWRRRSRHLGSPFAEQGG